MIASKHIDKIVLTVTAIGLALVILAMCAAPALVNSRTGDAATLGYEKKLFDTSQIITLNIKMDKADWKDLLKNAIDEKYYCCDVVINGTTFRDVGIRAKGNTSLTSVYNDPTTQRYSLKIEFGHYIKKQTCWGLDKLVLNNNYADATNMKEAVVYDMFAYLGANASLYNYAKISVNGSYWGVYLALEAVEKSFCLRNFGAKTYELYKPETAGQNKNDDSGTTQTSGDGGKKGTPDFQNGGNNAGADASGSKRPTPPDFSKTDGKPSSGTAQTGGQRDSKTTSGTAKTDTKTGSGSSSSADTATKATAKQPRCGFPAHAPRRRRPDGRRQSEGRHEHERQGRGSELLGRRSGQLFHHLGRRGDQDPRGGSPPCGDGAEKHQQGEKSGDLSGCGQPAPLHGGADLRGESGQSHRHHGAQLLPL
jgi:hypothetical protein